MTYQNTQQTTGNNDEFSSLRKVDRDWSKVRSVVAAVDQRAEQNTAWLGMATYLATMPLAALAGFVLYVGMF